MKDKVSDNYIQGQLSLEKPSNLILAHSRKQMPIWK